MYTSIPAAHTVVSLCKSHGIRQVVISPGSRNAPLILGFTNDPYFECFSLVDERSAAFFALGLSQQSGQPSLLVCTSGSALLNYYPAICEAYYSRIPMMVVSADRPPYKIDIGDGQTIRQDKVFQRHIGYEANLEQDLTHATSAIRSTGITIPDDPVALQLKQEEIQHANEARVLKAIETARTEQLPVHLNIPLEEPLYGMQKTPPIAPGPALPDQPQTELADPELWSSVWKDSPRKMVLVGVLPPNSISDRYLEALATNPSVLVFTETTSNLSHREFFPSIDSILAPIEGSDDAEEQWERLRPDLLLTLGGMVVSKKIKKYLRDFPPKRHWHIDPFRALDTFYALERHVEVSPEVFLENLLPHVSPDAGSDYRPHWSAIQNACREKREAYLRKIPFSDFRAFNQIMKAIPANRDVHLANSSTVRYAQLFDRKPAQGVYCNRGTSGIEGSTSTAVGAAWNAARPSVLVSGDLSFFYDSNALWNSYLRADFRMIVIHNSGGGIFRILPGFKESEEFSTYFETVHQRSPRHLCEMHGIQYRQASSEETLDKALKDLFEPTEAPVLLEVRTPRKLNNKILLDYFDFLS